MKATTSFKKIGSLNHINKAVQGSQGAGKTYSILSIWILKALTLGTKEHCSIVTDTFPNLRNGAIKDFKTICDKEGIPYDGTKNPSIYKIKDWTFEFFSVDRETKGLGGRRDRLFINEANRLPWKTARQLINRTHKERIFDFNPIARFWVHEQYVEPNDCAFVKLTYKDNEMLPQAEVDSIEKYSPWGSTPDENYWRVFGLGETGYVEGQIFKNYKTYTGIPDKYDYACFGTDFGWEDPLVTTKVYVDKTLKRLYWSEIFYASHARYEEYAEIVKSHPEYEKLPMVCDHSPRDIQTLRKHGFIALQADKKGGIPSRFRTIKQYDLFVNAESKNLIAELDTYKYQYDSKLDSFLDYPAKDQMDHGIDSGGYGTIFLDRR